MLKVTNLFKSKSKVKDLDSNQQREEIGYDGQCPKVINIGVKKNV